MTSIPVDEAASTPAGVMTRASLFPVRARDRRSRRADGRAARERAPRRDLGRWDPVDRGRDALAILVAQNTIRAEELVSVRNSRMAASPWTYYRGAAAVMAGGLRTPPPPGRPRALRRRR